jgi:4a-hydroxytetrahydrobiopterin dehydratase
METLKREYKFKDFLLAMEFVNKVAALAQSRDHHPDISVKYNVVELSFYTHTTKSVTEKDRQLAAEIDALN